jgi:hypothetical protein
MADYAVTERNTGPLTRVRVGDLASPTERGHRSKSPSMCDLADPTNRPGLPDTEWPNGLRIRHPEPAIGVTVSILQLVSIGR